MTHCPSHKRGVFRSLVNRRVETHLMPATVTMEVGYEPMEFPTREFLRGFLGCDDTLPGDCRRALVKITGLHEDRLMTYAAAAHELLAEDSMYECDSLSYMLDSYVYQAQHAREALGSGKTESPAG